MARTATKPATTTTTTTTKPATPAASTKPATTKPATKRATPAASTKPATTKPATSTKTATTKPATTKPAASKPATVDNSAEITRLEIVARQLLKSSSEFMLMGTDDAVKLADTYARLYALKAWQHTKPVKVTMAEYFAAQGIRHDENDNGYVMPYAAHMRLSELIFAQNADTPFAHLVIMSGADLRTIQRDKKRLGYVSETRSAAQSESANKRHAAAGTSRTATTKPATPAGVPMVVVKSFAQRMAELPELIGMIEDIADLDTIITLVNNRKRALAAKPATKPATPAASKPATPAASKPATPATKPATRAAKPATPAAKPATRATVNAPAASKITAKPATRRTARTA